MFELFGAACFYCGLKLPEDCLDADHVIPDGKPPLVPACTGCNRSKGDRCPVDCDVPGEKLQLASWYAPWVNLQRARINLPPRSVEDLLSELVEELHAALYPDGFDAAEIASKWYESRGCDLALECGFRPLGTPGV